MAIKAVMFDGKIQHCVGGRPQNMTKPLCFIIKVLSCKLGWECVCYKTSNNGWKTVPHISDIVCLPGQSNGVGTDHVHDACLSQKVLSRFKSRVTLAQNKYCLIPVVFSIGGHGLITFNKVRTHKADLIRNPKPCGNQEDPKAERTEEKNTIVLQVSDKGDIFLLKIPALVF